MHARRLVIPIICVASLCWPFAALAQKQAEERCAVEIKEPKQGDSVSSSSKARGSATTGGKHLWIFAHVEGLALWWPQCGGPASIKGQDWSCLVFYGQDRDRGSDFELAAVVLDEKDNNDMLNVIHDYDRTHEYPGVSLPPPAEGCPIAKVIVTRK
jgi:hypothetical protein